LSKVTGDLIQSSFILETGYSVMKTIEKQESKSELVEGVDGIAVCGSNFATPVTNRTQFIREVHYRIGDRLYIENAD
jgi:hypothetical protein